MESGNTKLATGTEHKSAVRNGRISVELRSHSFELPSEPIRGVVNLVITEDMPAYEMQVKIVGREICRFKKKKEKIRKDFREVKSNFLNFSKTIYTFQNGIVEAGDHPFEFNI